MPKYMSHTKSLVPNTWPGGHTYTSQTTSRVLGTYHWTNMDAKLHI